MNMIGGTLLADSREAALQTELQEGDAELTLHLLLQRDSWIPDLGLPQAYLKTRELLSGLRRREEGPNGRPAESNGWDSVVLPALQAACTSLDCSVVQRVNSELVNVQSIESSGSAFTAMCRAV